MFRLVVLIGVVVALCLPGPVASQKNPEPYDSTKPKKSSAKADTTDTKKKDDEKKDKKKDDEKKDKKKEEQKKDDKKKDSKKKDDAGEKDAKKKEPVTKDGEKKADKKIDTEKKDDAGEKNVTKKPVTKDGEKKAAQQNMSNDKTSRNKQPANAKQAPAVSPSGSGKIGRATFTAAIVDREPTDKVKSLTTDHEQVYFFTEVVDMAGKQIKHRWTYNNEVVVEVPFQIGGPRWRVYSSKKLLPSWVGEWKVTVVDESGRALYQDSFMYVAATQ